MSVLTGRLKFYLLPVFLINNMRSIPVLDLSAQLREVN